MSIYNKFCVFLVVNVVILVLSSQTTALTDEQRREIEKLRAELDDAFDNYEEDTPAGVVVQPEWTQKSDQAVSKKASKVKLTKAGIKEAAKLRTEINKAVQKNAYSVGNGQHVAEMVKEYGTPDEGKVALENIVNSDAENVGASAEENKSASAVNVVEAHDFDEQEIDLRKLQRLEVSKRRSREMLVLKLVEEDYSFNLGDDVVQWAHIRHNGQEYFIGRRESDLAIVRQDAALYEPVHVLDIGQPISYLETYSFWNIEQEQQEGVILVAASDKVLWYRGNNVTGQIELYWEWVVGSTISGLTHFVAQNNDYLVISSNESSRAGHYMLNVYQYELQAKEFWIAQRIQLRFPCAETIVLDTGRDILLAIPQNDSAAIFTFNPHVDASDHVRFKLKLEVPSEGIESIAGFQMGGRSYLALGGLKPQILLYQQGELQPRTILGQNFGLVELFLPVPVRTYRDDLILLVQHRVDFGTHGLTVLETLIWDGVSFETSLPVPCQQGGHTAYGISCILDIQRDEGLKGAALLRRHDEVSIIVPRHKAESGLFRLHTELLAKNSELLDLQDIFAFLKDWVKEQDDLLAQAQAFLAAPDDAPIEAVPDLTQLERLEAPEVSFGGQVGKIQVNDYDWTEEDSQMDLEHIVDVIEQLEQELKAGRPKRETENVGLTFDTIDVESMEADELIVELVNDEKFYIKEGVLTFEGMLNLRQLKVLEEVNMRAVRQTEDEMLKIDGNLQFEFINGIPWQEIRENLVFRNKPLELERLEVDGEVIAEDTLEVDVLNALRFPDDFLWSSGSSSNVVRAPQTFTSNLSANAVDIEGSLNGVNPNNAISLSDAQNWTGTPTFSQLRMSEMFELKGNMRGGGLASLPKNPTLKEAIQITANCDFKQLEVQGALYLRGEFNKAPLGPLLADVVQRPSDPGAELRINSKKTFSQLEMPIDLKVENGAVNGIPIEHFVPSHTNQELTASVLEAYIYFHNLTLQGRYDGVDILELVKNAIKIDDPQVKALNTQLNFVSNLHADSFNVVQTLNGVPIEEGLQRITEAIHMPVANFEHLQAKTAHIAGDIAGAGQLNGLKLQQFMQPRSEQETSISGNLYVDELMLSNGIEADRIHGIDAAQLFNFLQEIDDLPEMILNGKISVDHVIVTGDVQVNALNSQNFDEDLQLTVIWLNRPNFISTTLQFVDSLQVHGELKVEGYYNALKLPSLLVDYVFRSANSTLYIQAPKSFAHQVQVLGDTKLKAVNGIPFTAIATKKTINNFKGSVQLNGNLIVNHLELGGALNNYSMSVMSTALRFDPHMQNFVVQGTVPITQGLQLQDLSVLGNLNEMSNLKWFFENLVYKNKISTLEGQKVFTGRVKIEKGAYVRSLNGYNLLALMANIVYINEQKPVVITAPIIFKEPLKANEVMIHESLKTEYLNGCSLAEWLRETLRVDRPQEIIKYLTFAPGSLDGNAFFVSYLNDVDLSQVITLNTAQNISGNLLLSEVYLDGQITSQGPINNVDLQEAYQNTLLTHGNQNVSTPLTLQTVEVLENLQVNAPINSDKNLQLLATLNSDLEFESPLFFQDVTAHNLQTQHLVSGVNLEQWFRDALWAQEKPQQFISGNWSLRNLTVKSGPTLPSYVLTGLPGEQQFNVYVRSARDNANQGKELCETLRNMTAKQEKRAFFLNHLERSFHLEWKWPDKIRQAFVLSAQGSDFLLLNSGCTTALMQWQLPQMEYRYVTSFEGGLLEQVFLLPRGQHNASLLVTLGKQSNCSSTNLNFWNLGTNLTHLKAFKEELQEIYLSPEQQETLYALGDHKLYVYNLTSYERQDTRDLPSMLNNTTFQFVPPPLGQTTLLLGNGEWLLLVNSNSTQREKRTTMPRSYRLPLHYQRAVGVSPDIGESILKPNNTKVHTFVFGDFQQLVVNILTDLGYRLNLEVNITQLSIPESDLYDAHLAQDFLDIMQELKQQQIYSPHTFEAVNLSTLQIPDNPAQVLAARTVQIIWPVVVEIEEIHGYLRTHKNASHPICANITENLGFMVRDVLLLANVNNEPEKNASDYANELTAVIERIHKFQRYLEQMTKDIKRDTLKAENSQNFAMSETSHSTTRDLPPKGNSSNAEALVFVNDPWLRISSTNVPAYGSGEILALQVGSTKEPRSLLAIVYSKPHLVAGQHAGIALYLDVLSGSLFQTIEAHKPRALTSLRVRHETLLAYVEGCCKVRVLIYRGVQGFVDFTHFKTKGKTLKLLGVTVPRKDKMFQHYLATVHEGGMIFYQVKATGVHMVMPFHNCL